MSSSAPDNRGSVSLDPAGAAPRVSVCILSHRPHFLPLALASVWRQTYTDYEIVIKYAAPYWADKMNSLVAGARGEFVLILCDDDELDPDCLAKLVAEADRTGADLVYSDVAVIGAYENDPVFKGQRVHLQLPAFDAEVLRMHCVPYITALMRREFFARLGWYDGTQPYLDWDLWIRACQAGCRAAHLRFQYLFWPRSHDANGSKLMDNPEALRLLRQKHSALAQPPVAP